MNATLDSTTVIRNYSDLARNLHSMISSAKNEIYLASRYYEPSIGSVAMSKFTEGVALRILDANPSGISFEDRLRNAGQHDSKSKELIQKILATPGVITKVSRLDFSFIVVDGRQCGFELVNPANPDNFTLALKMDNPDLAKELILVFESMVASAERSKGVTTPKTTN